MAATVSKEQAIHSFWSEFGWKAYDENTVPDNAMAANNGHYLTYSVPVAGFDEPVTATASLWHRSTSWADISAKSEAIYDAIGMGGVIRHYTGGAMWVKRGRPFAQRMPDEDDTIRRVYINVEIEYFT